MARLKPRDPRVLQAAIRENQEAAKRARIENWKRSLPEEYSNFTVDHIESGWRGKLKGGDISTISRILKDNIPKFLILTGPAGTGKSTLAATLATHLMEEKGWTAEFVNSVQLMHTFSFSGEHYPISHYGALNTLVIDDIGTVNDGITANQSRMLWALIEARWSSSNKLTILTSNMSIQDNAAGQGLSSLVGQSAWDRISDSFEWVQMKGASLRGGLVETWM